MPFAYVGKVVEVEVTDKVIKIFHEQTQVALHERSPHRGQFITQSSHYPAYKHYTPQSLLYLSTYQDKMKSLGPATEALFSEIVKAHPYHWYAIVKGILNLRKRYNRTFIILLCVA